jgi:hypothetical protein
MKNSTGNAPSEISAPARESSVSDSLISRPGRYFQVQFLRSGVGAVLPNIGKKLGQLLRRASDGGGVSRLFLKRRPDLLSTASTSVQDFHGVA